jgi:ATP-grasp domain, R2K clade family 2
MDGFGFTHAFLQELGSGRLRKEEGMVADELTRLEIPFSLFTSKRIHRRQLPLTRETFLAGDMDCIQGALKQLDIPVPTPNDYPESLTPFLRRRTWHSTLGQLQNDFFDADSRPIFAKPANRQKRFTGQVFDNLGDFHSVARVSKAEPILCSDAVQWLAEYRVYVIHSHIVGVDHYAGDQAYSLNPSTVQSALSTLEMAGEAPAAYGIDFGVLHTGETALVEMNDGFALGAYAINQKTYTELLLTRWSELMHSQ